MHLYFPITTFFFRLGMCVDLQEMSLHLVMIKFNYFDADRKKGIYRNLCCRSVFDVRGDLLLNLGYCIIRGDILSIILAQDICCYKQFLSYIQNYFGFF